MFAVAIAIGVIFVSLIGGAAVLALAGFKGKDPSNAFGIYIGFVAAIFALLAVLGFVGSAAMIVGGATSGNRSQPVPVQQQPGGGQLSPGDGTQGRGGQQGPGSGMQGPGGQQGPGSGMQGRGGQQSPATPNQSPSQSTTPQALEADNGTSGGDVIVDDDSEDVAILEAYGIIDSNNADSPETQNQVRGRQGQQSGGGPQGQQGGGGQQGAQAQQGRDGNTRGGNAGSGSQMPGRGGNRGGGTIVMVGIAGVIASLLLAGFSVFLALWSLDLTGRRPWRKNRKAGSHAATIEPPPYDPAQTQGVPTESSQTAEMPEA